MRTKKVELVLETGELSHGVPLTIHCELTLYMDGTVTGGGVLIAPGLKESFAATGTFMESIVPASTKRVARSTP
jgi:hypothetical protein